jgi:hypothetical protein
MGLLVLLSGALLAACQPGAEALAEQAESKAFDSEACPVPLVEGEAYATEEVNNMDSPEGSTLAKAIPPIDAVASAKIETATFAQG